MTLLALAAIAVTAPTIDVASLVAEMSDLDRLTSAPNPPYSAAQASSYDRKSGPSANPDPFANGDAGQYIREERVDGRLERVMADLKGPGTVTRIWSANPGGTLRFYFDGETKPRFSARTTDLLRGNVSPFVNPIAYESARGCNIYFPFPYAKSLKITADNSENDGARSMYYHVGYRAYAAGTQVTTFSPEQATRPMVAKLAAALTPSQSIKGEQLYRTTITTQSKSGGAFGLSARSGPERTTAFWVKPFFPVFVREPDWNDSAARQNILRRIEMQIWIDGVLTVAAPLGDFFGAPPFGAAYDTVPMSIGEDGTMICRLPLAYRNSCEFRFLNHGATSTTLQVGAATVADISGGRYTLHAQWRKYTGSTRPMRDLDFVNATGQGRFVGVVQHIANPVPEWWGEGDEKIWVDGESFPSTFGTGTEDYFGYAWCCPERFVKPFHAQPLVGSPGNYGQTANVRWQTFDDVPFTTSLRFAIEQWHWATCSPEFSNTGFWYAPTRAGSVTPLKTSDLSSILETPKPKPIEGAIEGETMSVSATGGKTEAQGGFGALSNGQQLWWMDGKVGDTLTLKFNVEESGTYNVLGNFCHAIDYGIHEVKIDGVAVGRFDFWNDGVTWKKLPLGKHRLSKGEHTLTATCVGANEKSKPARQMFGLDYLKLDKG